MTMVNEDDTCASCGRTYGWHQANTPRHPFTTGEGPLRAPSERTPDIVSGRGIHRTATPFDPVLRMALIDGGILTPEMLEAAEKKIRFLTGGLSDGSGQVRSVDFQSGPQIRE
jgi:hypothetical protein